MDQLNLYESYPFEDELKVYSQRGLDVVKSNVLVRQARFELTATEQKIIVYLISKVKPKDDFFKHYEFRIVDFCDICGINKSNYKYITDVIKNLADKSFWLDFPDGSKRLCRWVSKAIIEPGEGIIQVRLDDDLQPYLLGLKKEFTKYALYNILAMNSAHSIRLYEILKSFENMGYYRVRLDELRAALNIEGYKDFRDFRRDVLEKALKEINETSDIKVQYEKLRKGRKIDGLLFKIQSCTSREKSENHRNAISRLDS